MLLRDKDKRTLSQIFSLVEIPLEVWVYGSRVNGTAHKGSDLDLVVRSKDLKPLPIDIYTNLCEKIRESNIPILVELRDWAKLPESFHQQIVPQHEVLFSNTEMVANEPSLEYKKNPKINKDT